MKQTEFEQAKREFAELLMQSESLQGSAVLINQFIEQHVKFGKYFSIEVELQRAKEIHPNWPDDLYVQLAVMHEEAGEVAKAILDFSFHKGPAEDIKKELIQTAAMCMRMLENFGIESDDSDLNALLEQHKDVELLRFIKWLRYRDVSDDTMRDEDWLLLYRNNPDIPE